MRARPFPVAQDQDFNIRVFTQIKTVVCTKEVLYYWVRHGGQISQRTRYYEIWPDILYVNYIDHQSEKDSFGYVLLDQLYRRLYALKARSIKTDGKKIAFEKCRLYYKNTISDYLKEKRISNSVKAKSLIAYHTPFIIYLFFEFLDHHPKMASIFKK